MEFSVIIDDVNRIKFIEGQKKTELNREQLEMGLRLLDAVEKPCPVNYSQSNPPPGLIPRDKTMEEDGHQESIQTPKVPPTSTKKPEAKSVAVIKKPSAPKSKPKLDINQAKMFVKALEAEDKVLDEEGNGRAKGTELPIRRAIVKMKGKIPFEAMALAVRSKVGMPTERFEIVYGQAGSLNEG